MEDDERKARRERMKAAMGPEQSNQPEDTMPTGEEHAKPKGKVSKGCLWVIGGLLALGFIGALFSDPDDSATKPEEKSTSVTENSEVNEKAMKDWYFSVLDTAKPCDNASASMGDAIQAFASGRESSLAVYQAATRAEDACRDTSNAYGRLNVPSGLPGAVEDAIDEAHETCQSGFVSKQMVADKAAEVFDGEMSNSNITRLQELTNSAQAGVLACVASSMQAVGEAGVEAATIGAWNEERGD